MKNQNQTTPFHCAQIILFLHIIFASITMLNAQNTNLPVGAIPGAIDVSPSGAATYTIPIEVVPGTQGMQPNLSIVYNSMSGMGLLGMKWGLSGLSAVTVCGHTPYYDNGTISAISFSILSNHKFALDGNRLININGTYGANNTEYATEIENFTRVVSTGYEFQAPILNHPTVYVTTHLTAYTDDGSIIEYGHSNDSKQQLGTSDYSVLSWYINKITDANGNYMTYHYGHEQNSNEIWINEINYTGNSNITPYAKVKFDYITLPDTMGKNTCFVGGYRVPQTKLLETITMYYGNTVVRKYQFNYNTTISGERTAHLKNIVLYGENGTQELNATNITWGNRNDNVEIASAPNVVLEQIITGDFNGDGYTDYVAYNQGSGTNRTFQLYLYNPSDNTFYSTGTPGNGTGIPGHGTIGEALAYSCDLNGDGRDELILAEFWSSINTVYRIHIYYYNNNAWQTSGTNTVTHFSQIHLGDFTGDGKVNIMCESRQMEGQQIKHTLSFLNIENFSSSTLTFYSVANIKIIDYNGNGKANIQVTVGANTEIYEYIPSLQGFHIVFGTGFPTKWHDFFHGDFNGDGITDIITFSNATWILQFGLGDGYYTWPGDTLKFLNNSKILDFNTGNYEIEYPLFIADINGDGKDDIIQPRYENNNGQTILNIYYSKGCVNDHLKFSVVQKTLNGNYCNKGYFNSGNFIWGPTRVNYIGWHLGDFNYDGKHDLMIRQSYSDPQPKIIYSHKNEQYEYVAELINGVEKKTTITYTPKYFSLKSSSFGNCNKVFMQLPSEIQTSNGIGNGMSRLQFRYENPIYGTKKRTFLGFLRFVTINTMDNITTTDSLFSTTSMSGAAEREILLPQYKILKKNVSPYTITQVEYGYNIVPLSTNLRFILHNNLVRNRDYLADTRTETTTTLENGRLKTSTTKTYNTCNANANDWLHSETDTYTYQTIALNGSQKKTVPTRVITTQQFGINGLPIADTVTYNYATSGTDKGRLNWQRKSNSDGAITTSYGNYTPVGLYQQKTVSAAGCTPRTENYTYDATQRFITAITNPLNHITSFIYDLRTGNKTSETDINGLTTTYSYDNFGRIKQINYPDGTVTKNTISWFIGSNPPNVRYYTKTTSTGKADLVVYYDKLEREVCRQEDGYYYDTRYNAKGQVEKTSYPYLSGQNDSQKDWHYYTYDNFGRISTASAPYVDLSYTYNNKRVTVMDHNIQTYKDYDALGRIITANDAGGTITYNYTVINDNNKKRHKTTITSNNAPTTIISDLWGNRLSITDPDAGTITSEYNRYNELTKQTDAKGNITTYEYDFVGRVTQKQITAPGVNPLTINYVYDYFALSNRGKGKLYQIKINDTIRETFLYDNFERLSEHTKKIDNSNFSFGYTYNSVGQLQQLTYPNNFAVTYSYTPTGKLDEIRRSKDNSLIYQVMGRNKYQQPTRCMYGDYPKYGIETNYTYNEFGLITGINTNNVVPISVPYNPKKVGDILNYRYEYNNRGLMISRSDNTVDQDETYTYDNLNRLTQIQYAPGVQRTITYANNGNITNKSHVGNYTYNGGKPHAVTQIDPVNNSVISAEECAVNYNLFNQPTRITEGEYQLNLYYGANQQRNKAVLKKKDEIVNTHYYINKYYEKEIDTAVGIKYYHYIYGDNGIVALHISFLDKKYIDESMPYDDPLSHDTAVIVGGTNIKAIFTDSMYYIHTDHLGSYCTITNEKGKVVQRNCFDPWGNPILIPAEKGGYIPDEPQPVASLNFTITARGFTGHEHYPYFKIINMNGRLYDPVIGRFFSPDKFVANSSFTQDFNRYSYARNNPLMYTDPSGEFAWFIPIIIGAVMGAVQGAMIAKANDAKGLDFAAYMFMGAGIGAVMGGIGGGIATGIGESMAYSAAGLVGAATSGTVSGALNGAAFTALAGGDPLQGMWTGALSGLAGSLVGAGIGGGTGAFFGGATSGAVGSALNGGSGKDILKSALFGGLTSFGAYQLQQAAGYYDYKKAGGEWNYRQYSKISVAAQRSFAWGREAAGWITNNNVGKIVYGSEGEVRVPPMPRDATASFHTHPNDPGTIQWHSIDDLMVAKNQGYKTNYVIGWNEMYKNNPMTHPFYRYYTSIYTADHIYNTIIPSLLTTYNNNLNPYPFYWFYFGQ